MSIFEFFHIPYKAISRLKKNDFAQSSIDKGDIKAFLKKVNQNPSTI